MMKKFVDERLAMAQKFAEEERRAEKDHGRLEATLHIVDESNGDLSVPQPFQLGVAYTDEGGNICYTSNCKMYNRLSAESLVEMTGHPNSYPGCSGDQMERVVDRSQSTWKLFGIKIDKLESATYPSWKLSTHGIISPPSSTSSTLISKWNSPSWL